MAFEFFKAVPPLSFSMICYQMCILQHKLILKAFFFKWSIYFSGEDFISDGDEEANGNGDQPKEASDSEPCDLENQLNGHASPEKSQVGLNIFFFFQC